MAKQKKNNIPDENINYIYPDDVDPKVSYKNKGSCLDVLRFADEKLCNGCDFEDHCVYDRKYKYYKPS